MSGAVLFYLLWIYGMQPNKTTCKIWHIAVTDPVMLVTLDTDLAYGGGGGTGWGNKWGMGGETVAHSDK